MVNLSRCAQQPCDDRPVWRMIAQGGFMTGVLCDSHRESWYDARDDHKTILERIQGERKANEVDEGAKMDRPHKLAEYAKRVDEETQPGGGVARADRVEGGGERHLPASRAGAEQAQADFGEGQGVTLRLSTDPKKETVGQYGALGLGIDEQRCLARPANAEDVEIRPDGIVYTPWSAVADRLDEAVGIGEWALVPEGRPQIQDGYCCWQFHLFVHGHWAATAIGEHPDSKFSKMSLANRAESAKSDALVKCSKSLGIFRELWNPGWRAAWQLEYCDRVWALQTERSTAGAWLWRRKDRRPFFKERPAKDQMESEYNKRRDYSDDAKEHLDSIASKTGVWGLRRGDAEDPA